MKYRSRADIASTILQAAMPGATQTRLMYGAFLSHAQIQEYLVFLKERQLLSFEEEGAEYRLTEKGLRFLRVYDEISAMVSLNGAKISENFLPPMLA
jgi:predicted transcriptional regulator